jgi:hypothetical protein
MRDRCVACRAEIDLDAARCEACGLAFHGGEEVAERLGARPPTHVALYLGQAPGMLAMPDDAVAVADETPAPVTGPASPTDRRRRRRRLIAVITFVLAGVGALVALIATRRPDDDFTRMELLFERLADADRLAACDPPPPTDVDASLARIELGGPGVIDAARALCRPLPPTAGLTVHAFFDAYLERLVEVSSEAAFNLGAHPHRSLVVVDPDVEEAAAWMLHRDAATALRAWPAIDKLPPHDRADLAAWSGALECALRSRASPDGALLERIAASCEPLVELVDIPCCPASARIAVATDLLRGLPRRLRASARLTSPPRCLVLSAADRLEDSATYLEDYASAWTDVSDAERNALQSVVAPARAALTACARELRTDVLARAAGPSGIGRAATSSILGDLHRLPFSPRELYARALDELRDAHDELRRIAAGWAGTRETVCRDPDEAQVRDLRDGVPSWIADFPAADEVVVVKRPSIWDRRMILAAYVEPGLLAPTSCARLYAGPVRDAFDADGVLGAAIEHRHVIAHETYPGHRLQRVASRSACKLRRFLDDGLFVEGWAVYAVDLVHETGRCACGPMDAWRRAWERGSRACDLLVGLLLATGAVDDARIADLLRRSGWRDADEASVGARAEAVYGLAYLVGEDEIVRLRDLERKRLGAAFDLRAFHAKLLAEGPIPPRLIEEEWRAEGR